MADSRIKDLPLSSGVGADDYVALDGVTNGTKKFKASDLGGKAEQMTEAEWDDLPDSKLTDGKVYALDEAEPPLDETPLYAKVGFAALDTEADNLSDAVNELNTNKIAFPDYVNQEVLHSGNNGTSASEYTGTFSKNGFVQGFVNTSSTSAAPFMRIIINNQTVFNFFDKYAATYIYGESPLFPVKAGDTYKITLSANNVASGTHSVFLYPLR